MSRLLSLFAAVVLAQAQTPTPGTGSIEGTVVNAKTGAPLKRATIRLVGGMDQVQPQFPGGGVAGNISAPGRRPLMMNKETDEQGHFVFTGLDAGKYRLTGERQGFIRQNYGARKYSGGSTPVAVGDGQSVKSIDFRLAPQGVITGKVLDEDGEPVARVQVHAQRASNRNGRKQWNTVASGTTSDIGEYRLPELQPGRYVVGTSPRNSMDMTSTPATEAMPAKPEMAYAPTFYPSTPDATVAVPVDVGEGGEVRNIDIRLVKTQVFRVRGKVTGIAQGGRAMIPVTLTPRDGTPVGMRMSMGMARAPEGTFEIRNVPPGQYLAHAQYQNSGQQFIAVANVDVIGGHVDGVVLALASGGDVQGSVKVVDSPAPIQISNLQVMLRPIGFGAQAPRSRVGEDLKFTLKSVPPVHYAVNVTGYPDSVYVKSIQYGGVDVGEDGVQMASGGTLEITLSAAAGQIDLVITTKDDKVANGAQVMILKDDTAWQQRVADENGMLSLHGLKPGSYRVIAWEDIDPNQLWDPDYLRKFDNDGKSVKIDANGHEAVQLKAIPPA